MPLPNVLLKIEDFDRCNWQDVINECPEKDCLYYPDPFFKKEREARKSGDIIAEAAFACSLIRLNIEYVRMMWIQWHSRMDIRRA